MNAEAAAKFRATALSTEGIYLRPSDIVGTERFKVIPWIVNNKITPIHIFFEGWIATGKQVRGPNGMKPETKPIRFNVNDEGGYDADPDTQWARGEYGTQTPKGCFVMIVAALKSKSIKVFSGTQKTLLGPIFEYTDPNSEKFVKNWKAFDLLVTRDKKTEKFDVERSPLEPEEREYPDWLKDALHDFSFSMDAFMECQKQDDADYKTLYSDVLDMLGDTVDPEPKKQAKQGSKPKPSQSDDSFEIVANWTDVVTPNGVTLGKCSEEDLIKFKEILDKKPKTDKSGLLYRAIRSGILAHAPQDSLADVSEDDEEVDF